METPGHQVLCPHRGEGLRLAPLSPDWVCSFHSPLQSRTELNSWGPAGMSHPAHRQPGHMLSEAEFCLNAQKGDLEETLKQINACSRQLLITAFHRRLW